MGMWRLQCATLHCQKRRKEEGLCPHATAVWSALHPGTPAQGQAELVADVQRLPHQHDGTWNSGRDQRTAALPYWGHPDPELLVYVQPNVPIPYTRNPPPASNKLDGDCLALWMVHWGTTEAFGMALWPSRTRFDKQKSLGVREFHCVEGLAMPRRPRTCPGCGGCGEPTCQPFAPEDSRGHVMLYTMAAPCLVKLVRCVFPCGATVKWDGADCGVHVVGGVAAPYCLLYEVLDKILLERATGMAGIVQSFTKRYRRANPNSLPFMSPSTLYGWFMSLYFLRWVDLREYNSSMPCGCTAGGFDCSMLVWDGIRSLIMVELVEANQHVKPPETCKTTRNNM